MSAVLCYNFALGIKTFVETPKTSDKILTRSFEMGVKTYNSPPVTSDKHVCNYLSLGVTDGSALMDMRVFRFVHKVRTKWNQ